MLSRFQLTKQITDLEKKPHYIYKIMAISTNLFPMSINFKVSSLACDIKLVFQISFIEDFTFILWTVNHYKKNHHSSVQFM